VGKDSLSMRTQWKDEEGAKKVTSPVSLIVSAFATLADVRGTLTPQLIRRGRHHAGAGRPGPWQNRMGGSILAQTLGQVGDAVPDLDDPQDLVNLVAP
jgi:phosphoribosylformylglycinamidine synthase